MLEICLDARSLYYTTWGSFSIFRVLGLKSKETMLAMAHFFSFLSVVLYNSEISIQVLL
ncbi:hypothetical protein AB4K20DRAFT_1897287, partial [Rhizopus microsporus]